MADDWGVQARYLDSADVERTVPPASVERLRAIVGRPPPDLDRTAPLVVRPDTRLEPGGEITLESGEVVPDGGALPLGYHRLHQRDGRHRRLIVSPGRCVLPPRRMWGWAAQLYAARSRDSWGIGDLGDLRTLTRWAGSQGAGFVLVNPLHAVAPVVPQQASPYFPSTRRFRNPIYLRIEDVPGAAAVDLSTSRKALQNDGLIDRDTIWPLKRAVLRYLFDRYADDGKFGRWRAEQGPALEQFATWCAMTDCHGADRHNWPAELRRPDSPDVAAFADVHRGGVAFYGWLQWLMSCQLTEAVGDMTVVQDLPIGVDPRGFDAWAWTDLLATDVTVGAPPDPFNLRGQDWGLPPFVPWRLRQADYQPFIDSIRSTIAAGGGLRIDHVMGLFRLWWIPSGAEPTGGGYVRYPADDLLDIVALESVRANALVIGEDLGTVEPGVRETLAARNILSYKLFWFEDDPAQWPVSALGALEHPRPADGAGTVDGRGPG